MASNKTYLIKRFLLTIVLFLVLVTVLFYMFRVFGGDPVDRFAADPSISPEQQQKIKERYGFDDPLHVQYYRYWENLLQGQMGHSFHYDTPVFTLVIDRVVNTLVIAVPALATAFLVGPLLGALYAWYRNTSVDNVGTAVLLFFQAAPPFWTGMIFLAVFAFHFDLFPSGGMRAPGVTYDNRWEQFVNISFFRHAALMFVTYVIWQLTIPALITRNTMIDILGSDFIRLNKAAGYSNLRIIYKHGLRNSLLPVLHYAALAIAFSFSGSVVIETVFSWPGIGNLMWTAVISQDHPLAMGSFLVLATAVISLNFVADVLSVFVDPRVGEEEVVN